MMPQPAQPPVGVSFSATRLSVVADIGYDELIDRFEGVVPPYPAADLTRMVERGDPWSEIVAFARGASPLGLLTYWHDSVTTLMAAAGGHAKCAFYLVGNFPVAERMYQYDPRVMNYLPLKMTITESSDGVVEFTTDQPSGGLASFGDPRITAIAAGVDGKVAQLLALIGLPVPPALTASGQQ